MEILDCQTNIGSRCDLLLRSLIDPQPIIAVKHKTGIKVVGHFLAVKDAGGWKRLHDITRALLRPVILRVIITCNPPVTL